MPPRHNYWTILFGGQPTAFRAATQEELLPTFKQIQGKHADAVMMWFARGKLWRSQEEARAAFDRRAIGGAGRNPSGNSVIRVLRGPMIRVVRGRQPSPESHLDGASPRPRPLARRGRPPSPGSHRDRATAGLRRSKAAGPNGRIAHLTTD